MALRKNKKPKRPAAKQEKRRGTAKRTTVQNSAVKGRTAVKKSAVRKSAARKKTVALVGSINALFGGPNQTGHFGRVPIGGPKPVLWSTTPLPAGERLLVFTFNPEAGHRSAMPELVLTTTGPFRVQSTQFGAPPPSRSIVVAVAAVVESVAMIFFEPTRLARQKGTLTIRVKRAELTGTFTKGVAFPLVGTGTNTPPPASNP